MAENHPWRTVTDPERDHAYELYMGGWTVTEIANQFRVREPTVRNWLFTRMSRDLDDGVLVYSVRKARRKALERHQNSRRMAG